MNLVPIQFRRTAVFTLTPDVGRFPNFPNYTDVEWKA